MKMTRFIVLFAILHFSPFVYGQDISSQDAYNIGLYVETQRRYEHVQALTNLHPKYLREYTELLENYRRSGKISFRDFLKVDKYSNGAYSLEMLADVTWPVVSRIPRKYKDNLFVARKLKNVPNDEKLEVLGRELRTQQVEALKHEMDNDKIVVPHVLMYDQ